MEGEKEWICHRGTEGAEEKRVRMGRELRAGIALVDGARSKECMAAEGVSGRGGYFI